jgi:predicted RNase H-like HicB family nuclease
MKRQPRRDSNLFLLRVDELQAFRFVIDLRPPGPGYSASDPVPRASFFTVAFIYLDALLFQMLPNKGRDFTVAIEKGEDGYYIASVVELPGCHTQAKTLKELDKRLKEAIAVNLEARGSDIKIPELLAMKKVHV